MTWRLIPYRTYSASENMAIDEAIFRETVQHQKPPTLRFYGWQKEAVSIGYFQDWQKEINFRQCEARRVEIVRRLTGGKAVCHRHEITYSLSAGKTEKIFSPQIMASYEKISLCLVRGLSLLGIKATLASAIATANYAKAPPRPANCFAIPSGNELVVNGKKICGSAQTRTAGGFLQQGSLLISFDPEAASDLILSLQTPAELGKCVTALDELLDLPPDAPTLANILARGFSEELGIQLTQAPLARREEDFSRKLINKYKDIDWNDPARKRWRFA